MLFIQLFLYFCVVEYRSRHSNTFKTRIGRIQQNSIGSSLMTFLVCIQLYTNMGVQHINIFTAVMAVESCLYRCNMSHTTTTRYINFHLNFEMALFTCWLWISKCITINYQAILFFLESFGHCFTFYSSFPNLSYPIQLKNCILCTHLEVYQIPLNMSLNVSKKMWSNRIWKNLYVDYMSGIVLFIIH